MVPPSSTHIAGFLSPQQKSASRAGTHPKKQKTRGLASSVQHEGMGMGMGDGMLLLGHGQPWFVAHSLALAVVAIVKTHVWMWMWR